MTTPPQVPVGMPSLFDMGNPLLATGAPASLITGKMPTPAGEVGVITIRTVTTTLTLTAGRQAIADWADLLCGLRDQMSESGLATVGVPSKLALGRR